MLVRVRTPFSLVRERKREREIERERRGRERERERGRQRERRGERDIYVEYVKNCFSYVVKEKSNNEQFHYNYFCTGIVSGNTVVSFSRNV